MESKLLPKRRRRKAPEVVPTGITVGALFEGVDVHNVKIKGTVVATYRSQHVFTVESENGTHYLCRFSMNGIYE